MVDPIASHYCTANREVEGSLQPVSPGSGELFLVYSGGGTVCGSVSWAIADAEGSTVLRNERSPVGRRVVLTFSVSSW